MNDTVQLEQQAINAAIRTNWKEAIELNKQILKRDKKNIDACIRLAFASLQANKINEAKKYYKIGLKFQPGNRAIIENLERIKVLQSKKSKVARDADINLDPNLFLETPGKTRSVVLVNPGQKNILAQLTIGQKVMLVPKKRKVEIRTQKKEYIGSLPDDISKRLTIFIKAGSEFTAYIKESNLSRVVVFIREEKKGKKVMKYTSFPTNMQSKLTEISKDDESGTNEEETEDISEMDLEKLAEILATEEKEYLPYDREEREEEQEE
jgi:tetratricopeptide (TPR) repeat protein